MRHQPYCRATALLPLRVWWSGYATTPKGKLLRTVALEVALGLFARVNVGEARRILRRLQGSVRHHGITWADLEVDRG